jgi:hypothetical protein
MISGLEPVGQSEPGLGYEIYEAGRAYLDLMPPWKQEVLWLRFTENQQWKDLRRVLRISRRKLDSILLEVQDMLMQRDPEIFAEEIFAEMEEHGGS